MNGHQEAAKLHFTVPGTNSNAKDNKAALIFASENGHHHVVSLHLTVPRIFQINQYPFDSAQNFI